MAEDDLYARATRLNAKLASGFDATMANEGRQVAQAILSQLQSEIADYPQFVERVERSELFSLHDSAQVDKSEAPKKLRYQRATELLETIKEAEARRKR